MMLGHQDNIILTHRSGVAGSNLATAAVLLAVTAAGCGSAASSTSPTVGNGRSRLR